MTDFAGLSAVVTGGASGIGLAIATRLADGGARVACLDLSPDGLPVNLIGIQADIADNGAVTAALSEAEHRLGGLDILVNNAGIAAQGGIETNDDAEWQRVLDVNVIGLVRVSRAALPALRRSAHASIVNTASIAAPPACRAGLCILPVKGRSWRSPEQWPRTCSRTGSGSTP